jgi:site-specific recombinase XerD
MLEQTIGKVNDLTQLVANVTKAYKDRGYSDDTIGKMRPVWNRYIEFATKPHFDEEESERFLQQVYDVNEKFAVLSKRQKLAKRAIFALSRYLEYGVLKTMYRMKDIVWNKRFEYGITGFLEQQRKNGRMQATMYNYTLRLNDFSKFLIAQGLNSFEELDYKHITDYLVSISTSYKGMSLTAVLSQLRVFCEYLYLNEYKRVNLSLMIPKSQVQQSRQHLPSIWSETEIAEMVRQIDRSSPTGKRDYAIITLVTKLGLRVSDIVDLQFANLDWEKDCISLIQRKTGEALILPLLNEVGDALIDYIRNARPQTEDGHIFVKHNYPYDGYTTKTNFHNIVCRYMYKAGITVDADKSHGLHSFRHTLATTMLKKGVPADAISEALGHKNPNMVRQYIRVDVEQLRTCTLGAEVANERL